MVHDTVLDRADRQTAQPLECPRCHASGYVRLVPLLDIWLLPPLLMQCPACGCTWLALDEPGAQNGATTSK